MLSRLSISSAMYGFDQKRSGPTSWTSPEYSLSGPVLRGLTNDAIVRHSVLGGAVYATARCGRTMWATPRFEEERWKQVTRASCLVLECVTNQRNGVASAQCLSGAVKLIRRSLYYSLEGKALRRFVISSSFPGRESTRLCGLAAEARVILEASLQSCEEQVQQQGVPSLLEGVVITDEKNLIHARMHWSLRSENSWSHLSPQWDFS